VTFGCVAFGVFGPVSRTSAARWLTIRRDRTNRDYLMSLRAGGGGVRKRRWSNGSNTGEIARQPAAVRSRVVWVSMCRRQRRSPHTAGSAGVAQPCLTAGQTEARRSTGEAPAGCRDLRGSIAILLLMAHQNQSTTSDMGSSLREDPYGTSLLFDSYARAGYKVKRSQDEDSLSDQNADRTTAFFIGGSP